MAAYSLPVKGTVKKSVLRNYIRHADTHNRVQEEREMWRLRQLEQQTQLQSYHSKPRHILTRGRLLSDSLRERPDDTDEEETSSTYWTRQLMKVEENDPDRWGHSGYKELYPEEFISTDEERGGKRKRERETKRKRPSTREQSKRTRVSASTSSGGSESEREFKRHKRKHKKKRNKKRDK
ncbi:PREDICTED: uncharacterized protein C11orf57-like [Amphimedon queenslandica]|uniref:Uncharacterized protein n=1 Tax=Amphimedon queenslandica TaxID=400682 RepID=A0A1X7U4W1_AMPQE|nr:PREDICTED: uncharacterized protein C11orf57-like [Amphimedon queenslandica]|eukprot:XP_011406027.1 PREDICTED: uncharacterized protein C11orf57-like [Amphimedon queenslandica]